MSYLHRHVDRRARCAVKVQARSLWFQWRDQAARLNNSSYVELTVPGLYARVDVDGLGVRWCVVMDGEGRAVLVNEDTGLQTVIAPQGCGAGMAHLRGLPQGGCEVYLMDGFGVNVYTEQGWFKRHLEVPYASEGLHHIEDDGTPVTEDQTRNLTAEQWQHVQQPMWRIDYHHGCLLGQIESDHLGFYRGGQMLELHPATPSQQSSSFGISDSGEVWFAVPGHDTPEPWEYRLEPRAKPVPAPVPTPQPPIPFPVPVPPQEPPTPIPVPVPAPEPPRTPTEPPAPPQVPAQRPKWQRRLGSVLRWLEKAGL